LPTHKIKWAEVFPEIDKDREEFKVIKKVTKSL
jgi:hypothetical protein